MLNFLRSERFFESIILKKTNQKGRSVILKYVFRVGESSYGGVMTVRKRITVRKVMTIVEGYELKCRRLWLLFQERSA